jgi:hypothetical protein
VEWLKCRATQPAAIRTIIGGRDYKILVTFIVLIQLDLCVEWLKCLAAQPAAIRTIVGGRDYKILVMFIVVGKW